MSEISPALARALKKGWAPFLAFYCNHPSGDVRFWSRTGKKRINGYEYVGIGKLGIIDGATRSTDLAINEVTFGVRGVPPDLERQLSAKVRNRVAKVWRGAISDRGIVVVDDDPTVDAILDYQKLSVDPKAGTATIRIVGQQGFYLLDRAQDIGFTDQQQRADYPGDSGMALVHQYANRDSLWRAAS